jgi:hypothetical protein
VRMQVAPSSPRQEASSSARPSFAGSCDIGNMLPTLSALITLLPGCCFLSRLHGCSAAPGAASARRRRVLATHGGTYERELRNAGVRSI